jgi:hypothetical protein
MNKAYILDLNLLNEQDITLKEFVCLLSMYNNEADLESKHLLSLQNKNYIKILKDENVIREKGKLLIEFLTIDSIGSINNKKTVKKSSRAIDSDLENFVDKYRELWKGLKPGSMGSTNGCREKLQRWMLENPKYSIDNIYNASKAYIKSVDDYKYLQQADYFIYKKDAFGEQSRLSSFIDEDASIESDWTKKLT